MPAKGRHDTQHNDIQYNIYVIMTLSITTKLNTECHYYECLLCRVSFMPSVAMLSVVMQSVVMLSVVMLIVIYAECHLCRGSLC
jgi:hypothetical protein